MIDYKIQCIPPKNLKYNAEPFELFFMHENAMLDFMDIVPSGYKTRHYRQDKDDNWEPINTWLKAVAMD